MDKESLWLMSGGKLEKISFLLMQRPKLPFLYCMSSSMLLIGTKVQWSDIAQLSLLIIATCTQQLTVHKDPLTSGNIFSKVTDGCCGKGKTGKDPPVSTYWSWNMDCNQLKLLVIFCLSGLQNQSFKRCEWAMIRTSSPSPRKYRLHNEIFKFQNLYMTICNCATPSIYWFSLQNLIINKVVNLYSPCK